MKRLFALLACVCILLSGCGNSTSYNAYALGQARLRELSGTGVDPGLVPALNAFTGETARTLAAQENGGNLVYSPANLYLALCMLSEVTAGDSRAQVLDLLGLETAEQAQTAVNQLWRNLYENGSQEKTLLANSLWLDRQADYKKGTVNTLARDYYTSVFQAPMGDPATDGAIADWIGDNTGGLLSDQAAAIHTSPETLLMLISALYFQGAWQDPFPESRTGPGTFTAGDGSERTVDFMHGTFDNYACVGEDYTAAALSFREGTKLWFFLPGEGLTPEDLLDRIPLDGSFSQDEAAYTVIHWTVPKLDLTADLNLTQALPDLGVTDLLNPALADFSPLTEGLAFLSQARHSARIRIDEEGCEAAAVTVEALAGEPMIPREIDMTLDRPFVFLITGTEGLPLFLGVVNTL